MALAHEIKLLVGEQGHQMLKRHAVAHIGRSAAVDEANLAQGEVFLTLHGRADGSLDNVTGLEAVSLDLGLLHIDVIGRGEVIVITRTQETVALGHYLQHALRLQDAIKVVRLVDIGIIIGNLLLLLLLHLALFVLVLLDHLGLLNHDRCHCGFLGLTLAFLLGATHRLLTFLLGAGLEGEAATRVEERVQ